MMPTFEELLSIYPHISIVESMAEYFEVEYAAAEPADELSCSEWAEKYRIIADGTSAVTGPWANELYPHTAGIMDALGSGVVREAMIIGATQLAKTEIYLNYAGYRIHQHPAPIMLTLPTEEKTKELYNKRLLPMIREAKDGILQKLCTMKGNIKVDELSFVGGEFYLAWATSASTLSSRPVEIIIIDEEDEMKPLKEYGHPVDLARERLKSFPGGILIRVGKPMLADGIVASAAIADYYFFRYVPCPHCGEYFIFELEGLCPKNISIKDFVGGAYYECPHCSETINEQERRAMLLLGIWRTKSGALLEDVLSKNEDLTVAFHISSFYAPFVSFDLMLENYLKAKSKGSSTLKVFYEGWLGINYDSISQIADDEIALIYNNREHYTSELLPGGVCILTAAVDVQSNRLEILVKGWGLNQENWHIWHEAFSGSPQSNIAWDGLDRFLARTYLHPCGLRFPVLCTVVDSGAFTDYVYAYTKKREGRNIFSIKGGNTIDAPIVSRSSLAGHVKAQLYTLNSHKLKDNVFNYIHDTAEVYKDKNSPDVTGFMHFNQQCDHRYFEQLTSEKKIKSGKRELFEKIEGRRNEILDMTAYNEGALLISGANLYEFAELIRAKGGMA